MHEDAKQGARTCQHAAFVPQCHTCRQHYLEALDMVLHMVMEGQESPHKLIQSRFLDMARQHDNADKASICLVHMLLSIFRNRYRGLKSTPLTKLMLGTNKQDMTK